MQNLKAIIGLGNPGKKYYNTRHNIGFRIIDSLADLYNLSWKEKNNMALATILLNNDKILLIKPLSYMNNSGNIVPFLKNQGIKDEEILVIHDELELPFASIKLKFGGSAKGHNGLRSIISNLSDKFWRLRFGISRPENNIAISEYVLQNFSQYEEKQIPELINKAIELIKNNFKLS